jgi:hypothetical protein
VARADDKNGATLNFYSTLLAERARQISAPGRFISNRDGLRVSGRTHRRVRHGHDDIRDPIEPLRCIFDIAAPAPHEVRIECHAPKASRDACARTGAASK